jgi:hypothetical protein
MDGVQAASRGPGARVTDDPSPASQPRPASPPPREIDTSVPHSARIWNYWLGGKDNYEVDREAGDKYQELFPQIVDAARAGRYFLARAVRYLAAPQRVLTGQIWPV